MDLYMYVYLYIIYYYFQMLTSHFSGNIIDTHADLHFNISFKFLKFSINYFEQL